MFVTYRNTEKADMAPINQKLQAWPMVELALPKAICLVSFQALGKGDAEPITRTLMVTDPYEFRELLSGQGRDLFVQGVNLLTPKELNGSKGWKVEQLIEASSITWYENGVKHYGFSYQVDDDKCYQDVPREYVESAQYVETIYSELRDIDPDLVG